MSISFNNAPLVSSGSVLLSSHMIGLADAFNSRIKSGLADCSKRIHQYTQNLTRQIRSPDADGNSWPSLGEFSMYYQMLDFDATPATWPTTEAGTAEGANVASPAAQFVFGVGDESEGTPGEGDYLTTYDFFKPLLSTTPEDYWTLAKEQRGAYDISTGASYTPMYDMAQRHFRLGFPDAERHHKTPGGYLPSIEQKREPCIITYTDGQYMEYPSLIYKIKRLSDDVIVYTGTGTCGPDRETEDAIYTGGSKSDVAYVADAPFAYYIFEYNGHIHRYSKKEYLLVRDGGGVLAREDGGQIQRLMIHPYISEYRGTEAQREQTCFDTPYIPYSFANQEFFTSQYQLAPASGSQDGDSIDDIYPSLTITTPQASGSTHTITTINDGYRLGGQLVKYRKVANDVTVQLLSDSSVIHTFTIYSGSSTTSDVDTFLLGPTSGEIQYRFASTISFDDASGYIYFEQSVLEDYMPEIWDAYAIIRMSSANGPIGDGEMDQRGIDTDYSRAIYDTYRAYGCFANYNNKISVEQQLASINTNPVFDAMRRYVNSYVRTINGTDMRIPTRPMLVGYETSCSMAGSTAVTQSILYFNRYMAGTGLVTNNIDCFAGIIDVNNSASNGIITVAPPTKYTNEWVMELCGKPYHPSDSSIWKTEVYANYYPYINRCHLKPDIFEASKTFGRDLFFFFQDGGAAANARELYVPESLSAYTYDFGQYARNQLNRKVYDDPDSEAGQIAKKFYQSCQVYPAPYVVSSISVIANDIVRVVLDRRLQHTEDAPTIIANDVASWDFSTVSSEPYRTDENIVRLFLLKMYSDGNNPPATIGDNSVNSSLPFEPNNPYASIFPTFFFTKLIPKPYINDGNENTGSVDVSGSIPRAYDLQLCETYLRAMCEGFVDETLSTENACNTEFSTDYDYTFANLCNDAFGGVWISAITGSLRDDYPLTYGPLPDMQMTPQVFNQIAKCVNKLTKVRLPLPYRMLLRTKTYQDDVQLESDWPVPASFCSEDGITRNIDFDVAIPEPTTLVNTSEWTSENSAHIASSVTPYCDGGQWWITATKTTAELAFDAVDSLAWYAVSDDLRTMISGSSQSAAIFVRREKETSTVDVQTSPTPVENCGYDDNFWFDPDTSLYYFNAGKIRVLTSDCGYANGGGEISPDTLGSSAIAAAYGRGSTGQIVTCHWVPGESVKLEVRNTRHLIIDVPTI